MLQVVVEGYHQLDIRNSSIDDMLADEGRATALRRFRNAIFHAQEKPFPEKVVSFLQEPSNQDWVFKLNKAFEAFFVEHLDLTETVEAMKRGGE